MKSLQFETCDNPVIAQKWLVLCLFLKLSECGCFSVLYYFLKPRYGVVT